MHSPSACQAPSQQRAEQRAGLAGPGGLPGSPYCAAPWEAGGLPGSCTQPAACSTHSLSFPRTFAGAALAPSSKFPQMLLFPALSLSQALSPVTSYTSCSAWVSDSGRLIRQCDPSLGHIGELTGKMWAHGHEACCYIHLFSSSSFRAMLAFYQAMTHSGTDP